MNQFQWDSAKNHLNIKKHGVSFDFAKRSFFDKNRIIAKDLDHSTESETRWYCIGKVEDGILTVRFTYRNGIIRIFGAGYWGKGIMKKKINYTEGEIGEIEIVKDFLPSPAELAKRESNVRVTINLRRSSVDFFKNVARKNNVQYQRVIRSLLDTYAVSYTNTKSKTRV